MSNQEHSIIDKMLVGISSPFLASFAILSFPFFIRHVIPAKAGISPDRNQIPAFAGMTLCATLFAAGMGLIIFQAFLHSPPSWLSHHYLTTFALLVAGATFLVHFMVAAVAASDFSQIFHQTTNEIFRNVNQPIWGLTYWLDKGYFHYLFTMTTPNNNKTFLSPWRQRTLMLTSAFSILSAMTFALLAFLSMRNLTSTAFLHCTPAVSITISLLFAWSTLYILTALQISAWRNLIHRIKKSDIQNYFSYQKYLDSRVRGNDKRLRGNDKGLRGNDELSKPAFYFRATLTTLLHLAGLTAVGFFGYALYQSASAQLHPWLLSLGLHHHLVLITTALGFTFFAMLGLLIETHLDVFNRLSNMITDCLQDIFSKIKKLFESRHLPMLLLPFKWIGNVILLSVYIPYRLFLGKSPAKRLEDKQHKKNVLIAFFKAVLLFPILLAARVAKNLWLLAATLLIAATAYGHEVLHFHSLSWHMIYGTFVAIISLIIIITLLGKGSGKLQSVIGDFYQAETENKLYKNATQKLFRKYSGQEETLFYKNYIAIASINADLMSIKLTSSNTSLFRRVTEKHLGLDSGYSLTTIKEDLQQSNPLLFLLKCIAYLITTTLVIIPLSIHTFLLQFKSNKPNTTNTRQDITFCMALESALVGTYTFMQIDANAPLYLKPFLVLRVCFSLLYHWFVQCSSAFLFFTGLMDIEDEFMNQTPQKTISAVFLAAHLEKSALQSNLIGEKRRDRSLMQ